MGFEDENFRIPPQAININDTRALHAVQLVRDALRNMGKIVAASTLFSVHHIGRMWETHATAVQNSWSENLLKWERTSGCRSVR